MGKRFSILLVIAIALGVATFVGMKPSLLHAFMPPTFAEAGGTRVTLEVAPATTDMATTDMATTDMAKSALERRLDGMGWSGASVRRDGERRLVVEVPGITDTDMVVRVVGTRGALSFRLVDTEPSDAARLLRYADGSVPPIAVQTKVWVSGDNLVDAQPGFDQQSQQAIVNFRFDATGAETFGRVTTRNVGRPFAIVLDDKVLSAPRILSPILGGSGQISGKFTAESARELATLLRAGSLPAGLEVVAVEQVKGKG